MEICREHLYHTLRFAYKNPSRIACCDDCNIESTSDCDKERLDHYDTDRILTAMRRAEEAIAIIQHGVDLMTTEQLSQWDGVRAWIEDI